MMMVKKMNKAAAKLKKLQSQVIKAVERAEVEEYFEKVPDVIRDRTRDGFGISGDDGNKKKLKKLAPSTIKKREYLERNGKLSSETTPRTSNLTESGQMLDSIIYKRKGKTHEIGFDERRSRNGLSPTELKDIVEKNGRKFFGLTAIERKKLEKNLADAINDAIKKIFK